MKLEAVIKSNIPKEVTKEEAFILGILFTTQILFNTIIPFTLGFLFALTENLLVIPLFILFIIINIRVDHDKDGISIKIIRNF